LPYSAVKRGEIIVFRWPVDIRQTYVKRCMGVPGDRIRIVNKEVYLNGQEAQRAVQVSQVGIHRVVSRQLPYRALQHAGSSRHGNAPEQRGEWRTGGASQLLLRDGRQSRFVSDSRYWGFVPRENIVGKPLDRVLVLRRAVGSFQNPAIGWDHLKDLVQALLLPRRAGSGPSCWCTGRRLNSAVE
jgi:signal peptidase I